MPQLRILECMQSKFTVFRALSFMIMKRIFGMLTLVGLAFFSVIFLLIWLLAAMASSWWWLLLIIWVPLFVVALAIRLGVGYLAVKVLYRKPITNEQKKLLNAFVDKLQKLLEVRGIGWPAFALLNIKDLVVHRELRSTKELITDTKSLKQDFLELETKLEA